MGMWCTLLLQRDWVWSSSLSPCVIHGKGYTILHSFSNQRPSFILHQPVKVIDCQTIPPQLYGRFKQFFVQYVQRGRASTARTHKKILKLRYQEKMEGGRNGTDKRKAGAELSKIKQFMKYLVNNKNRERDGGHKAALDVQVGVGLTFCDIDKRGMLSVTLAATGTQFLLSGSEVQPQVGHSNSWP